MKDLKEKRFGEKQEGQEHSEHIENIKDDVDKANELFIKKGIADHDAR
tara:strand:- start:596 stop:739 length:144 start_codon:yes stop_codon:yes gene_type:complete